MIRYSVLFISYALFSVAVLAQTVGTNSPESLSNADLHSRDTSNDGTLGANACISVTRLKIPRKARRLYQKALKAFANNQPGQAQRWLDQVLLLAPTFPEALTLYGNIQATTGQWSSAEQKLRAAIRADSTYSPAYVVLAGVYNSEERFDEAHEATQQALSTGADSWDLQYEIARALIGKQQYKTALATTEAALHVKHGSLLHLAKAHALLGLRRYSQAAKELRSYIRYQPDGVGSEQARDILNRIQAATGE